MISAGIKHYYMIAVFLIYTEIVAEAVTWYVDVNSPSNKKQTTFDDSRNADCRPGKRRCVCDIPTISGQHCFFSQ